MTAVNGAIGVMRKHLKEWLTAAPPEVEHEVEAAVEVAIETPTPARLPTLSVTLFSNAYRWDLWAAAHENRPARVERDDRRRKISAGRHEVGMDYQQRSPTGVSPSGNSSWANRGRLLAASD